MNKALSLFFLIQNRMWIKTALFLMGYLIFAFLFLKDYLNYSIIGMIAMLSLPFSFTFTKGRSIRYLYPAILFLGIAFMLQIKSAFLIAFIFGLMFFLESTVGMLSFLPVLHLVLVSQLFNYFDILFSFDLRLALSEVAASVLDFAGMDCIAEGNLIFLDGKEFFVDAPCAGLNMLFASLFLAIILVAKEEKKYKRHFGIFSIGILFSILIFLNILSNLFRIVILIFFQIGPDNFAHELAGLIIFLIYVIVPFLYFLSIFAKHIFKNKGIEKADFHFKSNYSLFLNILFVSLLYLIAYRASSIQKPLTNNSLNWNFSGYNKEEINGITKLSKAGKLIYIKPIKGFYGADHSPMVCWQGSGYSFKGIGKKFVEGHEVYFGTLEKGKNKIYTAWWYGNGSYVTVNQLEWRFMVLRGNPEFSIINVNAETETELHSELVSILNN